MRRTRAIAVVLAGIAVLASAALLAWRASEHGPGVDADPKPAARPTPPDGPEEPSALLEAQGPRDSARPARSPEASDRLEKSAQAPDLVHVTGRPIVEPLPVTLRLLRSDGGTVDRASVRIAGDQSNGAAWDPQTGVVSLPPGHHFVEVLGGRFGEWRQPEDFRIDVHVGMAPVEVTLRPWRMIVGRLKPAELGPAVPAGALLLGLRAQDGGNGADHRDERKVELRPPSDGWFSFGQDNELDPGTYEVSATSWVRGPVVATLEVVVTDRAVAVELDLPRRPRSDGMTLKLEDPDGRPLAPEWVMVDVFDDRGGGGSSSVSFERLDEGRYWLPTNLPGYSGRPPVSVTIRVKSSTFGERHVELTLPTPEKDVPIRFEAPARLAMSLPRGSGWLVNSDLVGLWQIVRTGRRLVAVAVFQDGKATIDGVQPGSYWLATYETRATEQCTFGLSILNLRPGQNELEVTSPPLHSLHVNGDIKALMVQSDDVMKWGGMWARDWKVIQLPAGRYVLRSTKDTAIVEIPSMSEITLGKPEQR